MLLFLVLILASPLFLAPTTSAVAASKVAASSAPDFSISINPTSRTVKRGSGTLYDIDVQALNGFDGTVTFTISGLCPNCTMNQFDQPPPVTGSGTSTFGLEVKKHTFITGTFTLTITATSGSLQHTAHATLIVR